MEKISELVLTQVSAFKKIRDYFDNFRSNYGGSIKVGDIDARIRTLEATWITYHQNDKLMKTLKNEETKTSPYFTDENYSLDSVEELFTRSLGNFLNLKEELSTTNSNFVPVPQQPARTALCLSKTTLPKVPLPIFDGNQLCWESFKELFKARVVNDESIAPVIKLQHLLSSLQGEASRRLSSLEITGANFTVAWETLTRRYDNNRVRLTTHLSRLISAPAINVRVKGELTRLLDTFEESIRAIRGLGRPVDHWDDWLVQLIVSKLDGITRGDWEKSREADDDFVTYKQLTEFLENRARTQDSAQVFNTAPQTRNQSSSTSSNRKSTVYAHATSAGTKRPTPNCSQCNGESHYISKCSKFLQMTVPQRRTFVQFSGICFNCLGPGHRAEKCPSKFSCRNCSSRHHTMLHLDKSTNTTNTETAAVSDSTQNPQEQQPQSNVAVNTISVGGRVLMATAMIILESGYNKVTVRALLDPAAEESFVTERVAQSLQLRRSPVSASVSVVGGETVNAPKSQVTMMVKSLKDSQFSMNISALVLNKLTNLIPCEQFRYHDWPHIRNLQMADPDYRKPARIDCILGAEVYAVSLLQGLHKGPYPSPIAQNTVFGWVLIGATKSSTGCSSRVLCNVIQRDESLGDQLQKFWEVEEPPIITNLTPDEVDCETHFQVTHRRDSEGRFVLKLPFIRSPELPGILEMAKSRFFTCERRLQADPQFHSSYNKFMKEYLDLNHMELVPDNELHRENASYIPHHGIQKSDGSGKIRVVFNASQRSENGTSLNDYLHIGPKLQAELPSVLTRWRFYKYVFTSDIVKMFRQFKIHPEDADWLRIFWRFSSDQPLQTYRLLTVTYGTASAPYQAIRCLKQLAADERAHLPKGASILQDHSYVDDNLGGDHDIESAIQARDELIRILATAGMQLDKWAANDARLLEGLNSTSEKEHFFEETVSTLGLKWKPHQDSFQFKVSIKDPSITITKRTMLSEIATLFDPLGWLSPVLIKAKVYIQELWIRRKDWDEPVDDDFREAWINFKAQLPDIEHISIPRWVFTAKTSHWELHGFSDASERAYAAVIYLVTCYNQEYKSSLITAKTKVAPVKQLSIPRLELCGAQLLSRIISSTRQQLSDQPTQVFCWSDSQTVLAWLKGHPSRWNTFVANRVSEIVTSTSDAQWSYVDTHNNPADLATRGISPTQLQQSALWWNGPSWLRQSPDNRPQTQISESTDCEAKATTQIFRTSIEENPIIDWFARFSSLTRLIKCLSYLFKWKHNSMLPPGDKELSSPTVRHYSDARNSIIKATQRHFFKNEIQTIDRHRSVKKTSHLYNLMPIMSPDGVLRIGGRLQNLPGSYDEKHPAIIPKDSHLARLLIHDAHMRTLHGGAQLVQSTLRRKYWIIHDRSQIRLAIKSCPRCLRYQGKPQRQLMAPLPPMRLQPSRPFTFTGVDYAGPFNLRAYKGRGHTSFKGYVSIFVCMVTRAVHFELVSDYTSKAFLAALRRFISRRGLCRIIYSDHGTNSQGACNDIQRLFAAGSQFTKDVATTLKADGIEWSFIPPKAPHFGGLWESKVKSFKHHLRRVAGDSTLTFEEFSTLLTQIEACINSRPLSPLTSDSHDICALTPGHFLIGGPINLLPETYFTTDEPTRTPVERWLLIQKMLSDFWRRWRLEVLHDLQRRSKWLEPTRNLQVNDIVIIKDDISPPAHWPLGRVMTCHPGPDGLTRVVTLRTSTTTLRRPITKLILLPANLKATVHLATVQHQG